MGWITPAIVTALSLAPVGQISPWDAKILGLSIPSQEATASNGVIVVIQYVEAARRIEYYSPDIETPIGTIYISRQDINTVDGELRISGVSTYRRPWRLYDRAVFDDGTSAGYIDGPNEVGGDCQSPAGCIANEYFSVSITPSEIAQHARAGHLNFELKSSRSQDVARFTVPVSYFDAITELAERD